MAEILVGLTSTSVFTFDSTPPSAIPSASNLALLGFEGGNENAVSIDRRPIAGSPLTVLTVGQIDSDNTATVGRLYDLDSTTGLLTNARIVNASFNANVNYTIDFNPTGPVALRIVGSDNSNYRVTDPNTGATASDTALSGDGIPAVGIAYSNNDNDPQTGTVLYNIDRNGDRLSRIPTPNSGVTEQFANALGIDLSSTGFQEIDISGSGIAYGVFQLQGPGQPSSRLYTLDLVTGLATPSAADNRFRIVNNTTTTPIVVRGIAAAPIVVPEGDTMALVLTGLTIGATLVRRRKISN
ncbi:MAG: DUF4394 domain-containing protein [Akkermansiaceae bacterium]|nr:DUF4394 domain-containing protein [Armatimonadota bacterium]